ncbi:unnamed protein product [Phytophthora lilii]|uniref:Unnamed protein product n=1 Tax=Phytophthora lilii TaxID=2077276 RepID=A0A9W6Y120_9STRA|nr:unnamed protein product [Phytophthora lilii]
MARSRIALVFLAVIASTTRTQAINWTFWNDDDDSAASTGSSALSIAVDPSSDSSASSVGTTPSAVLTLSGSSSLDLEPPSESSIATHESATNSITSTYRNWVGPWRQSSDSACYREAHIMHTCPSNYDRNELTNTCWTECPMDYPVECGMQCIQQNNDCGREVAAKASAVAMSTLSMVTFGDPQTSQDKLLLLLYQSNYYVTDLPIAIYACSGKVVPPNLRMTRKIMATAQFILLLVMTYADDIVSSWGKFKAFMNGLNFTEAAEELTEGEITDLESAMKKNSTCGADMRSLTNSVYLWVRSNGTIPRSPRTSSDFE